MSEFITKSTVKSDYGLSDSMIKELGEPDKTVPNPHYRSGSSMYLYKRERVEKFASENAERIAKNLKRRKPKAEEPESFTVISPLTAIPRSTQLYRVSRRKVGDKWSWSVYDNTEPQLLKTGWAFSEEEAKALCDEVIRLAELGFLDSYG